MTITKTQVTRLNQIIAVEKGVKERSFKELSDNHQLLQKTSALAGISRTYEPKDDDGEQLPPESTRAQVRADVVIANTVRTLTELFDITATKDWANCTAIADLVVDGEVLMKDVPVTYLMFLEKQLVDQHTFIKKLPTLDAAEEWEYDSNSDVYANKSSKTVRTKKILRNHVKAEATDKHPAQVEVYNEDIPVGYWTTRKFSGALPVSRVRELLERVEKLQQAVKFAREEANNSEVQQQHVGGKLLNWLYQK